MTNQVNCPNQNPAYSGITINITNPTLNPPGIIPPQPVCSQAGLPVSNQSANNQVIGANSGINPVVNPGVTPSVTPSVTPGANNGENIGMVVDVNGSAPAGTSNGEYSSKTDSQLGIYSTNPSGVNAPQYIVRDGYLVPVSGENSTERKNSVTNDYKAESQSGNVYQNIYNNSKNETKYINENQNPQGDAGNAYPAAYYLNDYGKNAQAPGNGMNDYGKVAQNAQAQGNGMNDYGKNAQNAQAQDKGMNNSDESAVQNSAEESQVDNASGIITDLDKRAAEQRDLEQNGKKTRVVALTNEYIMSLENYLNNPNKEIRLTASKEIIKRLDEDKSRYDDAALNALINKMLQDPDKLIRIAAMSALSSELASGNDYTIQILNNIQQNPNSDQEDVLEASEILLKRAAMTEVRYVKQDNTQPSQKYTMKVRKTANNQGDQQ